MALNVRWLGSPEKSDPKLRRFGKSLYEALGHAVARMGGVPGDVTFGTTRCSDLVRAHHAGKVLDQVGRLHQQYVQVNRWHLYLKSVLDTYPCRQAFATTHVFSTCTQLHSQWQYSLQSAFAAHVHNGAVIGATSGIYGCAMHLLEQELDVLHGYSLGTLCHVVHLAVVQQKIMGHHFGWMVPYEMSIQRKKERQGRATVRSLPQSAVEAGQCVVDWDQVCTGMYRILKDRAARSSVSITKINAVALLSVAITRLIPYHSQKQTRASGRRNL